MEEAFDRIDSGGYGMNAADALALATARAKYEEAKRFEHLARSASAEAVKVAESRISASFSNQIEVETSEQSIRNHFGNIGAVNSELATHVAAAVSPAGEMISELKMLSSSRMRAAEALADLQARIEAKADAAKRWDSCVFAWSRGLFDRYTRRCILWFVVIS